MAGGMGCDVVGCAGLNEFPDARVGAVVCAGADIGVGASVGCSCDVAKCVRRVGDGVGDGVSGSSESPPRWVSDPLSKLLTCALRVPTWSQTVILASERLASSSNTLTSLLTHFSALIGTLTRGSPSVVVGIGDGSASSSLQSLRAASVARPLSAVESSLVDSCSISVSSPSAYSLRLCAARQRNMRFPLYPLK